MWKLSMDIKELLVAWFDVGLLDLKEITWNSPAALLEKLIEYVQKTVRDVHGVELVHEVRIVGEAPA